MNAEPLQPPNDAITKGIVKVTFALADAIRDLGSVPNGHLYAQVMAMVPLPAYEAAITLLKESGVVVEVNHELIWKGVPTV